MKKSKATPRLPDYSNDWNIYADTDSLPELKARFYYEFARESATVLSLSKQLNNFSDGEITRGRRRAVFRPMSRLGALHPALAHEFARALAVESTTSWRGLSPDQRNRLAMVFHPGDEAFRPLDDTELLLFSDELHELQRPPIPKWQYKEIQEECAQRRTRLSARWKGSSRFSWDGIEESVVRIDWSQGPQAVKAAIEAWFIKRKRELPVLVQKGLMPGEPDAPSRYYRVRDEQGSKNPRRKFATALRGLAAMRLLSTRTLSEAISLSETECGRPLYAGFIDPDTGQPGGRSAWLKGVAGARTAFKELLFPDGEPYSRLRAIDGLPEMEEPISYQRLCARNKHSK